MNALRKQLSLVLVIQLVLAAGLWGLNISEAADAANQPKILIFDTDKVDCVEISADDESVVLQRANQKWIMPDYHELEANQQKTASLLKVLGDLGSYSVVSRTTGAHERFGVGDDDHIARIALKSGEEDIAAILFGNSPRLGRRYIRLAGANTVYDVAWNSSDIQVSNQSWFDRKTLVPGELSEVQFDEFRLSYDDGKWSSGELDLDQNEVSDFLRKVEGIEVLGAFEKTGTADFKLTLRTPDDGEATWTFFQDDGKYYIESSRKKVAFQVDGGFYDRLKNAKLQDFVGKEPPKSEK